MKIPFVSAIIFGSWKCILLIWLLHMVQVSADKHIRCAPCVCSNGIWHHGNGMVFLHLWLPPQLALRDGEFIFLWPQGDFFLHWFVISLTWYHFCGWCLYLHWSGAALWAKSISQCKVLLHKESALQGFILSPTCKSLPPIETQNLYQNYSSQTDYATELCMLPSSSWFHLSYCLKLELVWNYNFF